MNYPLRQLGTTVIAVFLTQTHSPAQGADQPISVLDEYVVTASRFADPRADAPNTVDVLTRQQLDEIQIRSLPEAFARTPGVLVQKTANGHGSPFIRGFTGFRNLLLIDGIRLNNSVFREGPNQYWNTVDPLGLDRIELVKGQGSVLYGSDAIGGTVNALTKSANPSDYEAGEVFSGGSTNYRWSSGEQSHTSRLEGKVGVGEKFGLHAGVSYKDYGDIRSADIGTQPHTGYDELDFDVRLDYLLTPGVRFTLAYQQVEQNDIWRTHKTIYAVPFAGSSIGDEKQRVLDQKRQLGYAQLEIDDPTEFIQRSKLSLSWQRQEESRNRVRSDGRRDTQGFTVDTLGTFVQFESELPFSELIYGASFYHDDISSFRDDFNADGSFNGHAIQGPVGDDATYDLLGVFAENRRQLGENFDLLVGARYTYAAADIGIVEDPVTGKRTSIEDSWDNFSASGKILWRPLGDRGLEVYGGVAQGFRAPNLSDLSRLDTARSNEIETPSPDLDPERFINYEIGLRTAQENFNAGIAYFYTDIQDMIVRAPTGAMVDGAFEVTKRNAAKGYVHGIEIFGDVSPTDRLTLFGNLTWMEGEADTFATSANRTTREPLSRIMPLTGTLGARYDATDKLWLELSGTAAARAEKLNTRDRGDTQRIPPNGTPGYTILSARAGYEFNDRFSIITGVENFTDEAYRSHGSGQNEPGVNLILSASLKF
ncbi:MAG: hemoglobin/transferrin/lactoferrin receptor protein [Verrucomicrobiales bacterium]|jgi:hemoglobin/transferrin/lactoferrin receptor protein